MNKTLANIWEYAKWPLVVLILAFIAFIGWRLVVLNEKEATAEAVTQIHANRLVWSDINGELPPEPDAAAKDATLAGVDSNQNGIRDDVERVIYLKYKDTPKVVIAMLQYAKALQMEFTHVYNSETFVAVTQEESRGSVCILDIKKSDEVDELVFNTQARKDFQEELARKFMTFYALPNENYCDINIGPSS